MMGSLPGLSASDEFRDILTLAGKRLRLLQNVLDQLRGLSGSRATLEDYNLRSVHRIDDLLAMAVDGQRFSLMLNGC